MDALLRFDTELFTLINHLPHTSLSNAVALTISGVGTAGIIWFILAIILFLKEEKKDHWFFLLFVLAGGVSWALVELVIKPLIARPRPTAEIGAIITGLNLADSFSFPSGHATIAWAMAMVLSKKEPKWKTFFFILAFLISFSRIYIGKHYPLDVVGGSMLGWGIGWVSIWVEQKIIFLRV